MKEVVELSEPLCGMHISHACEQAVKLAGNVNKPVHFKFNDTDVIAQPGEAAEVVQARWKADFEAKAKAYREDPQRLVEQAEREAEHKRRIEAHMTEAASTEAEMRDAKVPTRWKNRTCQRRNTAVLLLC